VSKRFPSETTWAIKTKLPRNDHWNGGHLGFSIGIANTNLVEDLPMLLPRQFGFNCPNGFREEAF
jgi:hypothetical protein